MEAERIPLTLLALPKNAILFPGLPLRINASRPDIPMLLGAMFSKALSNGNSISQFPIGCVPLNSPYLSPDGKYLIGDGKRDNLANAENSGIDSSNIRKEDLFRYGTVAKITALQGQSEPYIQVEGVNRFRIEGVVQEKPHLQADVTVMEDKYAQSRDEKARLQKSFTQLKTTANKLLSVLKVTSYLRLGSASLSPILVRRIESYVAKKDLSEAGLLADFLTEMVISNYEDKLQVLATWRTMERVDLVIDLLEKQIKGISGNIKTISITTTTKPTVLGVDIDSLDQRKREALQRKLLGQDGGPPGMSQKGFPGEADGEISEVDELRQKLQEAGLSSEARKVADRELRRLKSMNPANAEYGVIRNYLENLADIPWSKMTEDQLGRETISRARKQLDDDHYGLQKIKKRLIEYLAVLRMKQVQNAPVDEEIKKLSEQSQQEQLQQSKEDGSTAENKAAAEAAEAKLHILRSKRRTDKAPILLLVGPPGTGKTSLAKSIALALGRKFHRISLGGVRDEAEIRGHRRTYVAAMPGLIVNGLKKVGVANPVFLLDEIDKVGQANFQGDPSAAMLEVLDPEQNHTFQDHYINIPIDLSKVLFIATANTLETIPAPLLDRMETIQLAGYTTIEKRHIAKQHLIPKQIQTNGMDGAQVVLPDNVIDSIITAYTRESGVRNLEREIGSVCRYKAVQYAEATDTGDMHRYNPQVSMHELEDILGIEKFEEEIAEKKSRPGVVTGLVAYSIGGQGSILFIEVADMPGDGRVQLTGKLGDVLKESVEVALSWVKAHSYELGLTHDPHENIMQKRSIHVHCPSGAIPKDGPSAGLAHTIALISLFAGEAVPPEIAMTGEVSLRGRVMPVGGIKEKLIGAHRAGVKTVLLPTHNRKDVKDVPDEVKGDLNIVHVGHIYDALRVIWPSSHWARDQHMMESRL